MVNNCIMFYCIDFFECSVFCLDVYVFEEMIYDFLYCNMIWFVFICEVCNVY